MEDPIAFDLWGAVIPEHKEQAVAKIGELRPDLSRPAILREIILAPVPDRQVLIARDLAWDTARLLREQLVTQFEHLQVYQTGYGPSDVSGLKECPVHQIYYGGVLGCPVCDGWFR
jgi:hypothetical protein